MPTVDADGVALYPTDPAVEAIVTAATALADPLGDVQVGEIYDYITRTDNSNATENRGGESTLGNFVADVHLEATIPAGAEIALMNPGGLRANLDMHAENGPLAGQVSYRDAAAVQPFANTLVTLDLTGAQLRQVLEEQWQPAGSSRPFLKLGAAKSLFYFYDPVAPAGQHITTIFVNHVEVTDTDIYRVVVNSFLAAGGDNFATLAHGTNRADSGQTDLQAMVDYFADREPSSPDYSQRAVGVTMDTPAGGEYRPGQQTAITLSSLLIVGGESTTDKVSALLVRDGIGVSRTSFFPLDEAVVDNTDASGRSHVLFTIPAGAQRGLHHLQFDVSGTGAQFSIPIVITATGGVITVKTSASASAQRHFVSAQRALQLSVSVIADDASATTGTVQVVERGEVITTRKLSSELNGTVTMGIVGLRRGLHTLTVQYSGNAYFQPCESRIIRVLVY